MYLSVWLIVNSIVNYTIEMIDNATGLFHGSAGRGRGGGRDFARRLLTTSSHIWKLVVMLARAAGTSAPQGLTDVILLIFRVNGQLLAAGDRLVEHLRLTSARWQMLGAVALSSSPRTAPQLAAAMGVTRQGAQKQLNLLLEGGLVTAEPNPGHARSPFYVLTRKGESLYAATERVQR